MCKKHLLHSKGINQLINTEESHINNNNNNNTEESHNHNQNNQNHESTSNNHELEITAANPVICLVLKIPSSYSSHKNCFVCTNLSSSHPSSVVSDGLVLEAYFKRGIYIPFNSRCCTMHLNENKTLSDEALNQVPIANVNHMFKADELERLLESIQRRELKESQHHTMLSKFEKIDLIDSELCEKVTHRTRSEFAQIVSRCTSLRNSPCRTKEQCLAVFLFWLHYGLTLELISLFFGIKSIQRVSDYCASARFALTKDFVPLHLGAHLFPRDRLIACTTAKVRTLFGLRPTEAAAVADGTYCRCQKSDNNCLQRQLYSVQKKVFRLLNAQVLFYFI